MRTLRTSVKPGSTDPLPNPQLGSQALSSPLAVSLGSRHQLSSHLALPGRRWPQRSFHSRHVHRRRNCRRKSQNRPQAVVGGFGHSNVPVQSVRAGNGINVPVIAQPRQKEHCVSRRSSRTSHATVTENGSGRESSQVRRNQLVLRPAHIRPQLDPADPQAKETRHEHTFYGLQGPQGSGVGRGSRQKGIYEGRTRTLFQ